MPRLKVERPLPTVREVSPGVWAAGSRSRLNHFHIVQTTQEGGVRRFTCSCEHFTLGLGKECAHLKAVKAALDAVTGGG